MSDSLLKRDWEKICPKAEKEREDSRVNILKKDANPNPNPNYKLPHNLLLKRK